MFSIFCRVFPDVLVRSPRSARQVELAEEEIKRMCDGDYTVRARAACFAAGSRRGCGAEVPVETAAPAPETVRILSVIYRGEQRHAGWIAFQSNPTPLELELNSVSVAWSGVGDWAGHGVAWNWSRHSLLNWMAWRGANF